MAEKIRITWDDVNSTAVDQQLREHEAASRAGMHYDAADSAPSAAFAPSRLLYNALVYMTLFGFAGGVVGWALGEIVQAGFIVQIDEYGKYALALKEIEEQRSTGVLSESEAKARVEALQRRFSDNPYVELVGHAEQMSESEFASRLDRLKLRDWFRSFLSSLLWFGVLGVVLSFSLSCADDAVSRNGRGLVVNGSVGIVCGLIGGGLVSMFINRLYSFLGGGADGTPYLQQVLARAIGWGILGAFLAVAPGLVLKNPKRLLIGVAGGLIGGTLGGMMFDPIAAVTQSDVLCRFVGVVAIGALTGLGTGVIEAVAKTGWLRVMEGLIAGKQFILYKNPTHIGSSPQCDIYLFKDPAVSPRHAAIQRVGGSFDIQDLSSQTGTLVNGRPVKRQSLKRGDRIQIGRTVFLFNERTSA